VRGRSSRNLSQVTGHFASHYIGWPSEQLNILSYFYSVAAIGADSRLPPRIACTCERVSFLFFLLCPGWSYIFTFPRVNILALAVRLDFSENSNAERCDGSLDVPVMWKKDFSTIGFHHSTGRRIAFPIRDRCKTGSIGSIELKDRRERDGGSNRRREIKSDEWYRLQSRRGEGRGGGAE